ncbi:Sap190p KNAG_0C01530 [Huiozyma naganishii CBS 8797]|uniref:Uncharacterized protein n=1 Tax=Huiozyma naganishii (strain ATCC MYA-139 / BCRC 22969 / CBS 8797 / KCTC 17520 / NBRC 10181 / NCYC 3082 / Yp74L-3) TaxID=1071383 RepID=J7S5N7_HUIN7|nr:hypothetical protein KNAG_0C01530 [Kazachstania naganishii CBS 8797]CCK69266.1 hypothetical protein KNAG_0C01530 [Kazachstania naganishii CBS 8797]
MSGSFWKFGQDYSMESNVSQLLNRAFVKKPPQQGDGEESVSPKSEEEVDDYEPNLDILDDLVDDEELYTELMCSNFKLIVYFKYPAVLDKLIDYVTNEKFLRDSRGVGNLVEPSENSSVTDLNQEVIVLSEDEQRDNLQSLEEERERDNSDAGSDVSEETSVTLPPESEEQVESRRARMAAEVLSADVWQISTAIIDNHALLDKIWAMINNLDSEISVVVSTYFMKINERLLDTNINKMIAFILEKGNLVDEFLKHIDNPSLMDFLLKVISTDKADSPTGVISHLRDQDFIGKLLDLLDSDKHDDSIQSAAADFIKAFVTLSANSNNEISMGIGPNELTRQLVSEQMITRLITTMLKGGTSLSNGVGIIIELIRKNNSDYDFIQVLYTTLETHPPCDRDPIHLTYLIKIFAQYMPQFAKLLESLKRTGMLTPFGSIEPLGFERFKICELVAELLHCSNMTLLNESNGEASTRQRDLVRLQTLYPDEYPEEKISEELANLSLKDTTKSDSQKLGADAGRNTGEQSSEDYEQSLEIYPNDVISNSEELEAKLRESNIPGDNLKISLLDTGILRYIIGMFFKFEWNNFLHNVVFDIVQQIFNGPLKSGYNRFLLSDLLSNARLTDKIIEGDLKCIEYEKEEGTRLGYMGHLTLIAEEVAKFVEYIDEMKVTFSDFGILDVLTEEKWQEFMDTTLAETREKYNTVLGDFVIEEDEEEKGMREEASEQGMPPADGDMNPQDEDFDYYQENIDGTHNQYDYIENENDEHNQDTDDYYEYEDASGHKTVLDLSNKEHEQEDGEENGTENGGENNEYHDSVEDPPALSSPKPSRPYIDNMYRQNGNTHSDDDEDDYVDPNDDGQSYAKPDHPLYNDLILPTSTKLHVNSGTDSDTEKNDGTDDASDDDSDGSDDEIGYSLCRSATIENTDFSSNNI